MRPAPVFQIHNPGMKSLRLKSKNGGIFQYGTGDGDPLTLTLQIFLPLVAHNGIITIRETHNKLMNIGGLRSRLNLF